MSWIDGPAVRAAVVFGAISGGISLAWAVGVYTQPQQFGSLPIYSLVVITSVVVTALVGRAVWRLIVMKFDRWSVSLRGAIAGALTMWLSITITIPAVVILSQTPTIIRELSAARVIQGLSLEIFLETGLLFALAATTGGVLVGGFAIPIGGLVGYFLGRYGSTVELALPFRA